MPIRRLKKHLKSHLSEHLRCHLKEHQEKKWSPEEILIMKDAYKETSTEAFTPSKQLKSFCQENNLCERLNSTETQTINKLHSLKRL